MESEGHNTKSSDAKFDSYNIGRKEKVDYFSKNQPKPRKKIRDWKIFKGKNKFIILGAIVVLAMAVLAIWYFAFYLPNKPIELTPEEKAFREDSTNIYNETMTLLDNNPDNLASAMAYINDSASRMTDPNQRFVIRMIMNTAYCNLGMYQEALNYLDTIDTSGLDTDSMSEYYSSLAFVYGNLDDTEKENEYRFKSYELMGMTKEQYDSVNNDMPPQASDQEIEDILNGTE